MKERTKMETKGSKQKREENEREEKQRMRCGEQIHIFTTNLENVDEKIIQLHPRQFF